MYLYNGVCTHSSHMCAPRAYVGNKTSSRQNKRDRTSSSGGAMTQSFVSAHYT